jgi:hypothetical protein
MSRFAAATLALASIVCVAGLAPPAAAQGSATSETSFRSLAAGVQRGDTLQVIDADGQKTTGRFESISASSIVLLVDGQPRDIPASTVRRIVRLRDPLWNGAALGAVMGLVAGAGGCAKGDCGALATGALFLGAIGAGIDALVGGTRLIYSSAPDAEATVSSHVNLAVSGAITPRRKVIGVALFF